MDLTLGCSVDYDVVDVRLGDLGTLIVVTNTDGSLAGETVGPEAAKLDVSLGHVHVSEEKPKTEDWLGKDIENGVGDDLTVHIDVARTVSNTPDAGIELVGSLLQVTVRGPHIG